LLSRITAATSINNLFATIAMTMTPLLVLRELGLSPAVMGLVLSVGSVGGLLGALASPWISSHLGEGTTIPVSCLAGGLFTLLLPFAAVVPDASIAVLIVAEFGLAFTVLVYNITQVSFRQRVCPPRLLGRMNASIRFLVWGVMPIGALASGVLGSGVGVVPTMWIGAVGALFAAVPVWFSPLLGMRRLPAE
jgi:MFS family permease